MLILVYILSMIPSVGIFLWLRKQQSEIREYQTLCNRAILRGMFLAALYVAIVSTVFYVGKKLLIMSGASVVISELYGDFIMTAFVEEIMKFWVLHGLVKKYSYNYSWLEIVMLMTIVGLGFEITESVVYAFGAGVGVLLARGLTVMHGGYGFVMGYFIGKSRKTGQKRFLFMGIIITTLVHGVYDFCLSTPIMAINDIFGYIALALAVIGIILIVVAIVFIIKARKNPKYSELILCD